MAEITSKDRRSYMREALCFKVDYEIVSPEEFDAVAPAGLENFAALEGGAFDESLAASSETEPPQSPELIKFLMYLDDKLDRIIDMLSTAEKGKLAVRQGTGRNISGSGMEIIADEPVEPDTWIRLKFFLSKHPLTFMDLLGKVVRVTPLQENSRSFYGLGVSFVHLGERERETIITHVFRKQREVLRQRNI